VKNQQLMVAVTVGLMTVLGFGLTGCANKNAATDTAKGPDATTTDATTASTATDSAKPATPDGQTKQAPADNPELQKLAGAPKKVDMTKMTPTTIICTVGETPITVGDYDRQFKARQKQLQAILGLSPQALEFYTKLAKEKHIELTAEEKDKILAAARKAEGGEHSALSDFLAKSKITKEEFDKQLLQQGVAYKAATSVLQDVLLNDMVNRELLCNAARSSGFAKTAFNKYIAIKKSDKYPELEKATQLPPEQLREEIVKDELVRLEMEKVEQTAKTTDKDLQAYYDKNKDRFKHGERIKLSQIVIAAPTEDIPPLQSVKTQLKQQNPKMTDAELDAEAKVVLQQKNRTAQELLARAQKGEDFAKLANEYTEDPESRARKLGGDMGFHEKSGLIKEFVDKVWALKTGEVFPSVIASPYGFHVVKVTGREQPGAIPFAEVKDQLRPLIAKKNADDALELWINDKRRNTKITLSPEFQSLLSANPTTKMPLTR